MTTLAQRYNAAAKRLMPNMGDDLLVDPTIDCEAHIDEVIFNRSEYLGGMAAAILAMLNQEKP